MEWQFLKGEFELVDRTNNWFEVKFANPLDRETVWDSRPFYAFGNLLVLLPWVPNFDPVKMEIRTVDVWVRILYLPTEYITPDLIAAIIEHNEIGDFIRLDPFTEKRIRIKYARVCISIMKQEKPKNYVIIPTLEGEFKEYKLWYEGISEGCGSCGDENHLFELCPLQNPTNRSRNYRNEKMHFKEQLATNAQPEESFAEKGFTNMDWQQVSYRKGKTGYSIQLEKGKQRIIEEVAETEANQLKNEQIQQAQNQLTQQHQNTDHQNLPAVQNQINQSQGIEMENQQQPPNIQLEEDSFRTGNAGTSLTEQMKAVNVEDEYEATKKKKTRDTADTASTNSKRAKYSEYEDEDDE